MLVLVVLASLVLVLVVVGAGGVGDVGVGVGIVLVVLGVLLVVCVGTHGTVNVHRFFPSEGGGLRGSVPPFKTSLE